MTLPLLLRELQGSAEMVPEQFRDIWHRSASSTPEAELQLAMLAQAMEDLRRPRRGRKKQRIYREALLWVASDDERWPLSFLNVCARFGLDPNAVRLKLIGNDEGSGADPELRH